jgi:RNA polymerase sigma factor (sigma-70 family)
LVRLILATTVRYEGASFPRRKERVMEHLRTIGLLDSNGKPLAERIQRVLAYLLPKLRRQYPALREDEIALTEVLEEAGRRIAMREERGGPIEKLHGYAWVTIRCVATSHMRRASTQLIQKTVAAEASDALIAALPAVSGSPEEIERNILMREVSEHLSQEEWVTCLLKLEGFTSQEIAKRHGRSVVAVDTLFSRAKEKLRKALRTKADSVR